MSKTSDESQGTISISARGCCRLIFLTQKLGFPSAYGKEYFKTLFKVISLEKAEKTPHINCISFSHTILHKSLPEIQTYSLL